MLGVKVSGSKGEKEKKDVKKPLEKRPDNLIERLFTLPERTKVPERVAVIKESTPEQLRSRAESLLIAARVFRRDGKHEEASNFMRRYKGIRRTLRGLKSSS